MLNITVSDARLRNLEFQLLDVLAGKNGPLSICRKDMEDIISHPSIWPDIALPVSIYAVRGDVLAAGYVSIDDLWDKLAVVNCTSTILSRYEEGRPVEYNTIYSLTADGWRPAREGS